MILPYHADVPYARRPVANWVIVAGAVLVFLVQSSASPESILPWVLGVGDWGWIGSVWLHLDWLHLAGNMLFLWVFGNAVASKTGPLVYPLAYLGADFAGNVLHVAFDGGPSVGASGAINGVVGMFLVLYPRNDVRCLWVFIPLVRSFDLSSFWIILLWFAYDIWGAVAGFGGVAFLAHIGGFLFGVAAAVILLKTGVVRMERTEESLLQVLGLMPGRDAGP